MNNAMSMHPLVSEQVIVITGASSGNGRAVARRFGKVGAKVVLAARNEAALNVVAEEIVRDGGQALVVPTDVSRMTEVEHLARVTFEHFGQIDTWINNAAVSIYGTVDQTTPEEFARIIQVNYMGQVHGIKCVLPYMKQQGYGNIINVGSVESNIALPLQSAYAATKFAVKGFTEALRLEMQSEYPHIYVTLVMPSAINTPLFKHARSKTGLQPKPFPPTYSPDLFAEAVFQATKHHQRDVFVGGAGMFFSLMQRFSPHLLDKVMLINNWSFDVQQANQPDNGIDNLEAPIFGSGSIKGDFPTKASLYTPLLGLLPDNVQTLLLLLLPISVLLFLYRKQLLKLT